MKKKETSFQVENKLKKYYPDLSVRDESLELLGNILPRKTRKVDDKEESKRI